MNTYSIYKTITKEYQYYFIRKKNGGYREKRIQFKTDCSESVEEQSKASLRAKVKNDTNANDLFFVFSYRNGLSMNQFI